MAPTFEYYGCDQSRFAPALENPLTLCCWIGLEHLATMDVAGLPTTACFMTVVEEPSSEPMLPTSCCSCKTNLGKQKAALAAISALD